MNTKAIIGIVTGTAALIGGIFAARKLRKKPTLEELRVAATTPEEQEVLEALCKERQEELTQFKKEKLRRQVERLSDEQIMRSSNAVLSPEHVRVFKSALEKENENQA